MNEGFDPEWVRRPPTETDVDIRVMMGDPLNEPPPETMSEARLEEIVWMNTAGDIRNMDDFEEMATEVRRLWALVPEWRDAKTCPPTEDGKYLVHAPSADPEKPLIATAWWHADGGWSLLPDYWIRAIRHWMPLPAPPVEGGQKR